MSSAAGKRAARVAGRLYPEINLFNHTRYDRIPGRSTKNVFLHFRGKQGAFITGKKTVYLKELHLQNKIAALGACKAQ
jgi:hypothetical protein